MCGVLSRDSEVEIGMVISLGELTLTLDVEGDLNSLSLTSQKQVLELVALIGMVSTMDVSDGR